ncbi:MAG: aspartate carbamoyltransferase catalytic subunit [Pseudooceanicola sp.]
MTADLADRARGDGWEGILDPGERILWQGRPDPAMSIGRGQWGLVAFGLFFSGFAAVWMALASLAGGYFWTFGLLHFTIGLCLVAGAIFGPTWRRRHTWYTLTDRRAFIATDMPLRGRTLKAWEIGAGNTLFRTGQDPLGSVIFAQDFRRTKNGTSRRDIGFERIPDADVVLGMIRQIKGDAA